MKKKQKQKKRVRKNNPGVLILITGFFLASDCCAWVPEQVAQLRAKLKPYAIIQKK